MSSLCTPVARCTLAALTSLAIASCAPLTALEDGVDPEVLEQVQGGGGEVETESSAELFRTDRVVELHIDMTPAAWQAILDDPQAEVYQPADLRYGEVELSDVAIRTKGNSSLHSTVQMGSQRFPFKVDLDRSVAGQRLHGKKKFVLNNGFKDPSFLREHLAYWMLRDFGLPAPRTGFVDLWVAGEHLGLYLLVEVVDGDFIDEHFDDDSGDLYKPEMPAGWLWDHGDDPAGYEGLGLKRNEETTDHAAFLGLIRALHRGETLEQVLDVDEALRYLAASTALVNLDSYQGMGHNYYLYEQAGVFTVIPWDLNEAFGIFTCNCSSEALISFFIDEPTCGPIDQRPLVERLLERAEWKALYHQHLAELLDLHFDPDLLQARLEAGAALIRPNVESDPTRFYSMEEFDYHTDTTGAAAESRGSLLGFVRARADSLRAQLAGEQAATGQGEGSCGSAGQGPPPEQSCSAEQPCPEEMVCVLEIGRCVPDCRQRGCPPERPSCVQENGLCE